jgi:hypothetical protein
LPRDGGVFATGNSRERGCATGNDSAADAWHVLAGSVLLNEYLP